MIFKTQPDTNTLLVLRCIWLNPRISRTDIAKVVELDQSTVSRIVTNLLENGIVQTSDGGQSGPQGGRKPIYLKINRNFGCVIGIELQSEEFTLVGINLLGEILFMLTEPHNRNDQSVPTLFFNALQKAYALVAQTHLELLGIGVGMPGIIDSHRGIIMQSNPLEIFEPLNFYESIAPLISVPVRIEHDARCCCRAELTFHRGRCPRSFLYVLGEFRKNRLIKNEFEGIALGLGLVINNRVYSGENFAAGEFRSVFYNPANRNQILGIPDYDLARLEESPEIQIAFGHELGLNLALLVNVLNLSKIFVGGSIERLGPGILDMIRTEVESNWLYKHQTDFDVAYTQLGKNAVAYGAAGMFLEMIFSPPDTSPSLNDLLDRIGQTGNGLA